MMLNRNDTMEKGPVFVMLVDTQTAHSIGGFKVGVGFALRPYRDCLAITETMSVSTPIEDSYTSV